MKSLSPLRLVTAIITVVQFAVVFPPAHGQAKTEISGWLRAGISQVYKERYGESFYQGKAQFEVKVSKDLEAQIDIRGESDTHEMELREAYLTADLGKAKGLNFGQSKKRFGLEFQKNKEKLLTIERTLIYRHLEPIGFVGRDLNLRYYRHARSGVRRNGISASIGYNEAHDVTVVGHWERLNTMGSLSFGASAAVQLDQFDTGLEFGRQTVWAFGMELLRDTEAHHVEIEAIIGQDPFASVFERSFGEGENVYFFGGKMLYGHRFKTSRRLLKAFEPVLVASVLAKDIDRFERNTLQFLGGANFYLAPSLRLSLNGDLLLTSTPTDADERSRAGSNVILQVQLSW
jgi:hypothetical protein